MLHQDENESMRVHNISVNAVDLLLSIHS